MRTLTLLILLFSLDNITFAQITDSHQLLLTPQRVKRLKRDQNRQTPRWLNFEERIKNVPTSPERGFELALYYAITGDEARGQEAVRWAKEHGAECRQKALILDWCKKLIPDDEQKTMAQCSVQTSGKPWQFSAERDLLFMALVNGSDSSLFDPQHWQPHINDLIHNRYEGSNNLYAAIEVITTLRTNKHVDLREQDRNSFNSLPVQFLLSLKPQQTESPDWMTHIAALALVSLDANSDSSQFLQGWSIEDRQMVHEGPGVAYELLWADPYLPGVGYQNLDPWWYSEETGTLLARNSWQPDACWIRISTTGMEQQNCPNNWQTQPVTFGHMQLIPVTQNCLSIARTAPGNSVIWWQLKPNQRIKYTEGGKASTLTATASGLWRVPINVEGKACAVR